MRSTECPSTNYDLYSGNDKNLMSTSRLISLNRCWCHHCCMETRSSAVTGKLRDVRVTEQAYFYKSLEVTRNDTLRQVVCKSLSIALQLCLFFTVSEIFNVEKWRAHNIWVTEGSLRESLVMLPFESLVTVSYSHSTSNIAVSLAVSTEYTNVTDRQTDSQPPHDGTDNERDVQAQTWTFDSCSQPENNENSRCSALTATSTLRSVTEIL